MTTMGPVKPKTFGGFPLFDMAAISAEVDLYTQRDETFFGYDTEIHSVKQQWTVIRRYVNGRLHSSLSVSAYKLKFIRDDVAVVAMAHGDGPGRRYYAVGIWRQPKQLFKGETHGE